MSSLPLTFTSSTTTTSSSPCFPPSVSLPKSPVLSPRSAVFFRSSRRTADWNLQCVFSSVRACAKTTAELVEEEEYIAASTSEAEAEHSRTFIEARTGQELLYEIRTEAEAGRLPSNVAAGMEELYHNYRNAVFQSGDPMADEIVLSNMAVQLDRVLSDVENPYDFSPYHKALREPFDYYMFGQNYFRPLIDFRNSYVGNLHLFYEIEEKLKQGHNVVFISNHQSEADPVIIALLLEKTNPHIVENMMYVAGDRVITDPLCKPFSMGRNLICVYSKKHMYDDPELVDMKRKANTRSLKEMALRLKGGSQLVWIAPSGGRDRPDTHTGEWYPAPFDSSSVDNMRRLVEHSGLPGHIYPLALLCYDIMPPPPKVEKEIGEKRVISFHGVGLSVAPEVSFPKVSHNKNPDEAKEAYNEALYNSVTEQYNVLKSAVHGKRGLGASTPGIALSQPWN